MTNPTSNYGFVLPTSTDLVTDLPADFDVALQGVDTRLKALQPGTTLGDIAYSSATANTNTRLPIGTSGQVLAVSGGGVPAWTTTADVTPLTTKGDLFTFDTADARLGVGTNGQTLVADSTASTGLKWATPAGGSMTLLSTTTLSGATSINITSISQSYTNLYILVTGLNVTTGTYTLKIRPNLSGAVNYTSLAAAVVTSANPDYISPGYAGHSASSVVNDYAMTFYNYTDSTNYKPFSLFGIAKMSSQVEPLGVSCLGAVKQTAAMTSIQFDNDSGGNFTAGTVKIYGVN